MKEIGIVRIVNRKDGRGTRMIMKYQCECGEIVEKIKDNKHEEQTCQKCLGKRIKESITIHGMSGTKLQGIWNAMIGRCYNPKNKGYKSYGAKGVTVCEEWKNSFDEFSKWAFSTGYLEGHNKEIDKDKLCNKLNIEPKIYSPETCQWITLEENRTKIKYEQIPRIIELRNSGLLFREIAKIYNVTDACIRKIVKNNT